MKTKQCTGCGQTLPIALFGRHAGHGKMGLESKCKQCMRQEDKRKREAKYPATFPAPKLRKEMEAEYRAMLEPTADAFKDFFETFSGYELHEHGYRWVKEALANDLLLLNVPPGHAKTTIMAQWFVIWHLAQDRNAQVIVVSKTQDGARKTAAKVSYELEYNRKLNMAYGRFRSTYSQAKWSAGDGAFLIEGKDLSEGSGDVSLQIRGMGQQILGMRATLVVGDDVADRKVAKSEQQRTEQTEWFLGEVMTRLQPTGKAVCIGQRVHTEDLYGVLAKLTDDAENPVWLQIKTPAILDRETKTVLWEHWWPWEKLEKRRHQIGSALFETMYQQNPEASGEFVKRAWIEGLGENPGCLDRDRLVGEGWKEGPGEYFPITRVISIDPSPTRYCGMVVADVVYMPNQQVFIANVVDIRRGKFGLREMIDNIQELTLLHGPQVCIFEENSAKWLHEDPAWNRLVPMFQSLIAHNTGRNKLDPVMGVWSLGADFEAGRIRFPYGDQESREVSELLIGETLAYPNGQTDDVLMALWFIKPNYMRLMPRDSMPTRFSRGLLSAGSWSGWS